MVEKLQLQALSSKYFEKLVDLHKSGQWNKCLKESINFFEVIGEYSKRADFLGKNADYTSQALHFVQDCLCYSRDLPDEIKNLVPLFRELYNSDLPGDSLKEKIQKAIYEVDIYINGITKAYHYENQILSLFVKDDQGYVDSLWIGKGKGFDLCPRSWSDKTYDSVTNSFNAVDYYLKENGLLNRPGTADFQLNLVGWLPQSIIRRIDGGSLGLGAAVHFFSQILSVPHMSDAFKIPENIATTGGVSFDPNNPANNGKITKVLGIEHKLNSLFCEIPHAKVYIPKENETEVGNHTRILGEQIFPVTNMKELFQHLFANNDPQIYETNLTEAIKWLNGSGEPAPKKTCVYWSQSFVLKVKAKTPDHDIASKWAKSTLYYAGQYIYHPYEKGETTITASNIRKEAWGDGVRVPTLLENYGVLARTRFTDSYKDRECCRRFQLKEDIVKSEFSDLNVTQALLTWENVGLVTLTLLMEWENLTKEDLIKLDRREEKNTIKQCAAKWLDSIGYPCIMTTDDCYYRLTIMREFSNYDEGNAANLIAKAPDFFYSLFIGTQHSINPRETHSFKENNQSTRSDVFLAISSNHALLVESNEREKFTATRIPRKTEENKRIDLMEARKYYNDINYLMWLEILLKTRTLMQRSSNFSPGVVLDYYHRLAGPIITGHNTYQTWINHWKSKMGLDNLYQRFMDQAIVNNLRWESPSLSAVGVILNERREVLITKRKVKPFIGCWVMPGGKIDYREKIKDGVLREVQEEVGLKGKLGELISFKESLPCAENQFRHYVILYFRIMVPNLEDLKISEDEIEDIAWVDAKSYDEYKHDIAPRAQEVLEEIFKRE